MADCGEKTIIHDDFFTSLMNHTSYDELKGALRGACGSVLGACSGKGDKFWEEEYDMKQRKSPG